MIDFIVFSKSEKNVWMSESDWDEMVLIEKYDAYSTRKKYFFW